MKNKFIEKPFNKFLKLKTSKNYFIKDSFEISETQAQTLLKNLKSHCYLISHKDTKFFDIEETYYDTTNDKYQRLIDLDRPKTVEILTQKIHLTPEDAQTKFLIKYKNFHKHQLLQIPTKNSLQDWEINSLLQQKGLSFPILQAKHTISFTRVYLYQPHTKTKIFIDLDIYSETKKTPEARLIISGSQRKNPIAKMVAGEGLEPSTSGL